MDGQFTYKLFAGKSKNEAIHEFQKGGINAVESLEHMPLVCFLFYHAALAEFLNSNALSGKRNNAMSAAYFLSTLNLHLNEIAALKQVVSECVVLALNKIAESSMEIDCQKDQCEDLAEGASQALKALRHIHAA